MISRLIVALAARRLRRRRPEWADAIRSEYAHREGRGVALIWAVGCLAASFRIGRDRRGALYPAALGAGLCAMVAYQWSADESIWTFGFAAILAFGLGLLAPRRLLASGLAIGAVVAVVNAFESVTGVRPAYEATLHPLAHALRWVVLAPPAVAAAAVGAAVAVLLTDPSKTPV